MIRADISVTTLNNSLYSTQLSRHDYFQVGESEQNNCNESYVHIFSFILWIIGGFNICSVTSLADCVKKKLEDVKPAKSDRLILHGVQKLKDNCFSKDMNISLSATVKDYPVKIKEDKTFELDIDADGNAPVPIDPCHAYTIFVTASVGGESKQISNKFNYNKRSKATYPFNKVFKNEVIDKICVESKNRIRIPDPPTSIESCVFTKGVQNFHGERVANKTYSSGNVAFEMIDPESDSDNPARICLQTLIDQIEDCSTGNGTKQRNGVNLSRFAKVNMEECKANKSMLVNVLSVTGGLLAVGLIVGVSLFIYKKVKGGESSGHDSVKGEPNPMYRDYYGGGSRREQSMEIWNRNSSYGASVEWGEGATVQDNNPYYGNDP